MCPKLESNVLNMVISAYVYGAVELQAILSVEIVPAPSGLLQDFVCWPTPYSCDKTYFLDHLLNIEEIYLCCCGIGPPPHLRCKYCCHELQWFRVVAGPCSASHWPVWHCHQTTPWKYDSPAVSPIWPKDALLLPMSPHARYQDTHKMIRKTTSTPLC